MGISIKRVETEHLARQLADVTGMTITDAIHNALALRLRELGVTTTTPEERMADIRAWLAEVHARPRFSKKTMAEIDEEMYDDWGNPK